LVPAKPEEFVLPSFQVTTPHALGKEAAVERLKHFADRVAAQYKEQVSKLESHWSGDALNFKITVYGFSFSGVVAVSDNDAVLNGTLPFAALPFRGRIESGFASELKKALS
jgi:hypothetical protein